jgi:hypothetical protein
MEAFMLSDKEELANLSQLAVKEFRILVEQNMNLVPEWKQTVIQLLGSTDIPQDLEPLKRLIGGDN